MGSTLVQHGSALFLFLFAPAPLSVPHSGLNPGVHTRGAAAGGRACVWAQIQPHRRRPWRADGLTSGLGWAGAGGLAG